MGLTGIFPAAAVSRRTVEGSLFSAGEVASRSVGLISGGHLAPEEPGELAGDGGGGGLA